MKKFLPLFFFLAFTLGAVLVRPALAHENYVLTDHQIEEGMHDSSLHVFDALKNPANLLIAIKVAIPIFILFVLYFLFISSRVGIVFDLWAKRFEPYGHAGLRVALAASFLASAYFNAFLGPEIPLSSLPGGVLLRPILVITGCLLLVGFLSEFAGLVSLGFIVVATVVYGQYMMTYFNYYGEFVALILFGSYFFSVDRLLKKTSCLLEKFKPWELPLIRITYGISVLYPAITIKFLHPKIILDIVEKYHMTDIHWLFPSDPLLISLGTGAAQVVVGLFIIFGFETRLSSFITLILYTLSILFFKEAVWPHYILLALAAYLTINDGGIFSIDNFLEKRRMKKLGIASPNRAEA